MACNRSLLLFGHGDGGGGPHTSHLEQLQRLQICKGLPNIRINFTPEEFFNQIKNDFNNKKHGIGIGSPPVPLWVGELYLELHQGTLTSQALIKKLNRSCENLLRGLETLYILKWIQFLLIGTGTISEYSTSLLNDAITIKDMWKTVLLNQFHDVIRKYRL